MNLLNNERIDDLQYKGLKLIQKTDGFCFGVDAVLLSHFAHIRRGDRVLDMGTGTGIVPVLLAGKTPAASITGLEIQEPMAEMAARSVQLNGLESRVKIVHGDIRRAVQLFGKASFDVVTVNPPYMKPGGGLVNPGDMKAVSRHEILCTLEDVVQMATMVLAPGGQFVMVHRPERLVDIVYLMRSQQLEPKYIRFVHPSPYKKANMILIRGYKGGKPELKMMEPLYVYDEKGCYSAEINEIYNREEKEVE